MDWNDAFAIAERLIYAAHQLNLQQILTDDCQQGSYASCFTANPGGLQYINRA